MNEIIIIFLVIILGLALGRISVKGIKLGYSGILIIGLFFGHFGAMISPLITNIGLLLFVTGVGYKAGPVFIKNFKNKALAYIVIGVVTIIIGMGSTILLKFIFNIPMSLALGVMTGALTSTPGLAAAIDATGSSLVSVGYGIAYPFGVVGVILFVQLILKIFKIDSKKEVQDLEAKLDHHEDSRKIKYLFKFDKNGFQPFFLALVLGSLLGMMKIPLLGNTSFSLGNAGGAMLTGLLFGYLKKIGPLSLEVNRKTADTLQDFGLLLFFVGTGVGAGSELVSVLKEYGVILFIMGAIITQVSMIGSFLIGNYVFKLVKIDNLGAMTGAMTSTPGLGVLVDKTKSDSVAASYVSTYPVALILIVIFSQFMGTFLS